jgi:ferredoxin
VVTAAARWRIEVDRECIGSGMCAASAAAYFRLDGGRSTPVRAEVDADEVVRDAAEQCPMEAIRVVDVSSGDSVLTED